MAKNYVEVKIKASDDGAKADLDALRFDLDAIGMKVESARVEVDDKDAAAKLLSLAAKLEELNRKVANPRLTVEGEAKVRAQLAYVDAAMDKLNEKHADPKVTLDGAAKVLAEIEALDHELDHLNDKANNSGPGGLIGRLLTGVGSGGMGSLGPVPVPALAALVPAIGAVSVELVGLASGFASAGAGAGAFYLLAHPAINNLTGDIKALDAANQAVGFAQQKAQLDPTKANVKALESAQLKYKAIYQQMGQDAGPAAAGMLKLHDTYVKLSNAFQPQVFKIFNDALKIANQLLPSIVPMANAFANALDGLLKHVGQFTQSKGFADWLKQFTSLIGPSVTAIGNGIGKVVVALGKLLTLMSKKDVVNAINIAFTVLADTITVITAAISRFMQNWDGMSRTVVRDSRDISRSFDSLRHGIAVAFDAIRHAAAAWVSSMARDVAQVVMFFLRLPGRMLAAVASLPGRLRSAGINAIAGLLGGLVSEGARVIGYVENLANSIISAFGRVLHIFSPSKVFERHGRMIAAGLIQGLDGSHGAVMAAAGRLAGATLPGGYPAGGGGRGGTAVIQIAPKGGSGLEQQFWTWLKNGVRAQGGDPAMFQKKVAYR